MDYSVRPHFNCGRLLPETLNKGEWHLPLLAIAPHLKIWMVGISEGKHIDVFGVGEMPTLRFDAGNGGMGDRVIL
jgi:hypothetical protein